MKDQIINPLIRFRRKAQGRFANRIGGSVHGRAISIDESRCFFIVNASIGDNTSQADVLTIRFNETADAACGVAGDWAFKINGSAAFSAAFLTLSGNQAFWQLAKDEAQGVGNLDTVTFSYTPGSCRKDGEDAGGDCDLEGFTDQPVDNDVFGPNAIRIGDVDNQTVVAFMNADVAVLGDVWTVRVNGNPVTISTIQYGTQPNRIQFVLAAAVTNTDVLTLTHAVGAGTECEAVDGRQCWDSFNMPVENVIGQNFWVRQDNGAWLVEDMGRWKIQA